MVELDRISGLSQTSNYMRMNLRGELKTRTGLGRGSHITLRLDYCNSNCNSGCSKCSLKSLQLAKNAESQLLTCTRNK